MIITKYTLPTAKPPADFNLTTEKSVPAETPREARVVSAQVRLLDSSTKALNRSLDNVLKCPPEMFEVRSQMGARQVEQYSALITQCLQALSMEERQQLFEHSLQRMPVPLEISDDFDAGVKSSNDFFDKLLELIDLIKNGYLAGYEHIIAAYSDFFKDFNAEITAKMKDWIEGANDGKEVKLNAGALKAALESLLQKYSHPNPASVLFPKPGQGGASREEAEKWREALGLPASCLKQNADGTWCVVIDTGPLLKMKEGLPSGTVTWDTAKFQAWQTGFNAQEERMKNTLQSFTQKYSNANSYHDNFNKTLSSHLSQFADMLKAMLNF
ncbi:IpaD/SipD/SspD family type III secretion system needle tip protein [Pseudomonas izuensis]|uniref:IpaD/SipD/SspD family type III secretion system needle tip protein n=1 Tax=Pseudomonas izuensis TaxID=2684212 RepID=A0ABM7RXR3_9PSED|nr:IpaD/SipD/SspD family type III secretion system needle tip protein [Pseudomonas izuensis]BCX66972.1 IpaD/SipD/SspD family type III secretion system needle tip protein [Pseudomonas izuensis]